MRLLGSLAVMGPGGSAVWGGSIGPICSFKFAVSDHLYHAPVVRGLVNAWPLSC